MNWFWLSIKKTFTYQGRARRREYGWFIVFSFLISLFTELLINGSLLLGLISVAQLLYFLDLAISLALSLSAISLTARRLHDLGHSGWWQLGVWLIVLIMVTLLVLFLDAIPQENLSIWSGAVGVTAVILLIAFNCYLLFFDGQAGENRFGANPKAPVKNDVAEVPQALSEK